MKVHTYGPKADKDRALLLAMYKSMVEAWNIKPISAFELSGLDNLKLNRLCADLYNSQTNKEIRWFQQITGQSPRSKEFKWRWWFRDTFTHPQPIVKRLKKTQIPLVLKEAADGPTN